MRNIVYLIIAIFVLGACSSSAPSYNYSSYKADKDADYTAYKTFGYYDFTKKRTLSPKALSGLLMVEATVTNQMQLRGFQQAKEGQTPDLYINVGTLVQEKTEYTEATIALYPEQYPYYWGSVMYATHYDNAIYGSTVTAKQYKEGTLLIDLVDAKKNSLVWHGAVSRVFNPGGEGVQTANLDKQIIILFDKEFPVPVK